MTDDRDICERLEDKSINGAIFLRINAAMEIRRLREYSSKQALDIVTLGQELGRLREALERLIAACDAGRWYEKSSGGMTIDAQLNRTVINGVRARVVEDARAALAEEEKS